MANTAKRVLIAAGMLAASGCLTVADDAGPILAIELFWDEEDGDTFVGGTCDSAGVASMEWTLIDEGDPATASDDVEVTASEGIRPCYNAIDVIDPDPGRYKLEIRGYDDDDQERWAVECSGMDVLRFDIAYDCNIRQ